MITILLTCLLISSPQGYSGAIWIHSETCGPCKQMLPDVMKLIVAGEPIIVVTVTTQQQLRGYSAEFVPTMIYYRNGKEVGRAVGYRDKGQLKTFMRVK